jgi:hypothetical protein
MAYTPLDTWEQTPERINPWGLPCRRFLQPAAIREIEASQFSLVSAKIPSPLRCIRRGQRVAANGYVELKRASSNVTFAC